VRHVGLKQRWGQIGLSLAKETTTNLAGGQKLILLAFLFTAYHFDVRLPIQCSTSPRQTAHISQLMACGRQDKRRILPSFALCSKAILMFRHILSINQFDIDTFPNISINVFAYVAK
jgi:hypothetical protein